jgi:hypothetical protein
MKAIRTIVATAVIVFALTTVAMAGVQRLGNGADAGGAAQAQPAAAPTTVAPAGAMTLSKQQFAALLHAVAAQDRTRTADHERTADRTHARDKARSHTGTHATTRASHGTQGSGGSTQHATTRTHTQTQHGGTHDGTHNGGTHDGGTHHGGTHDGGCD